MSWTVIVPMRGLARAKSRLRPASSSEAAHRDLVTAMRRDTVSAVAGATRSARVIIVAEGGDDMHTFGLAGPAAFGEVIVLPGPVRPGLNEALTHAARVAGQQWRNDAIAAVVGDLPTLTADVLDDVLGRAGEFERGVVLDRHDTGTTILTASPGVALNPQFGLGSGVRHLADGAVSLPAPAAARCDVDTADDLVVACRVGLGPATAEALAARDEPVCATG